MIDDFLGLVDTRFRNMQNTAHSRNQRSAPPVTWPPMLSVRRGFVRQVVPPRLRPAWRVAGKAALALVTCAFVWGASRALAIVVADHEWKQVMIEVNRQRTEMELARDRERYEAWRKASSDKYTESNECELLYHRDVAVCDLEMLQRLAAEAARGEHPHPAVPSSGHGDSKPTPRIASSSRHSDHKPPRRAAQPRPQDPLADHCGADF